LNLIFPFIHHPQLSVRGVHWSWVRYLSAFTVLFASMIFLPPLLTPYQFFRYPLISWGDACDFLTPLIVMPLYWLLLMKARAGTGSFKTVTVLYIMCTITWISGQGMIRK
jgi:hypothetical protein